MKKALFIIGLLLFSISITQAQDPCAWLFEEGSLEYVSCQDFVKAKAEIASVDARMALIQVRTNNITTSFASNGTDRAWVDRILPTVQQMADDLTDAIGKRNAFLLEVIVIKDAVESKAGDLPDWVTNAVLVDETALSDSVAQWSAIDNDLAVLLSDLQNAQNSLPPVEETSDAQPETDSTEPEIADPKIIPLGEDGNLPTNRDIVTAATELCQDQPTPESRNACIFQAGVTASLAVSLCEGQSDPPGCYDTAIQQLQSFFTPEEWAISIAEYSATEDPYASLAVYSCGLNPVFNDEGEEVPLGNCAEIELINIMDAVDTMEPTDSDTTTTDDSDPSTLDTRGEILSGTWEVAQTTMQCDEADYDVGPFRIYLTDYVDFIHVDFSGLFSGVIGEYELDPIGPNLYSNAETSDTIRILAPDRIEWLFHVETCVPIEFEATLFSGE